MKGLPISELLDALEAGRSLLVWIASWHAATGDEAVQLAWEEESSALAMRQLLGLIAEDDVFDGQPRRLSAEAIRRVQPEAPSLIRLLRISRKVLEKAPETLPVDEFVRRGWWTAVAERLDGEDPVTWVWSSSQSPHRLAELLSWVGMEDEYGQALHLLVDDDASVSAGRRHDLCASIRGLPQRAPRLADLPHSLDDLDDPAAVALADYVRRLVRAV